MLCIAPCRRRFSRSSRRCTTTMTTSSSARTRARALWLGTRTRAVTCCPLHVACRVLSALCACCVLHMQRVLAALLCRCWDALGALSAVGCKLLRPPRPPSLAPFEIRGSFSSPTISDKRHGRTIRTATRYIRGESKPRVRHWRRAPSELIDGKHTMNYALHLLTHHSLV